METRENITPLDLTPIIHSLDGEHEIIPEKKLDSLKQMKYIFVCGSTLSGLGKGSLMSSLGILLKACGLKVNCIKIDPYLNVDAGTMSPFEHGEVFVLHDGGETDLDLGNYERSMCLRLNKNHNITSGKVYSEVINKERRGEYLGKTVQLVPHVTSEINNMIIKASTNIVEREEKEQADVCLVEIGGTIGDFESDIFFEAIRQLTNEINPNDFAIVMLSYFPEIGGILKTKPCQHGIKQLKSLGLVPNFLCCRSVPPLSEETKSKIKFYANLPKENVISVYNVDTIWDVPAILASQNLHFKIMSHLNIKMQDYKIKKWLRLSEHIRELSDNASEVKIAICGKYVGSSDSYYSVMKSLQDAAFSANRKLVIKWLDTRWADDFDQNDNEKVRFKQQFWKDLETCHGILIPGGFGLKGVECMIQVCKYARDNLIPFLGICLGMQCAVIEYCRNVMGIKNAHSREFDQSVKDDVITTMDDTSYTTLGGTLRLGEKPTIIKDQKSLAYNIYGKSEILERHRHRYEVNPKLVEEIEESGLIFSGKDKHSERMTILELPSHPFYLGTQFHPEFATNPFSPTPIFYSFVLLASKQVDKFRQYIKDRKPGIRNLEEMPDDVYVESSHDKYKKIFEKVQENEKRVKKLLYSSPESLLGNIQYEK